MNQKRNVDVVLPLIWYNQSVHSLVFMEFYYSVRQVWTNRLTHRPFRKVLKNLFVKLLFLSVIAFQCKVSANAIFPPIYLGVSHLSKDNDRLCFLRFHFVLIYWCANSEWLRWEMFFSLFKIYTVLSSSLYIRFDPNSTKEFGFFFYSVLDLNLKID